MESLQTRLTEGSAFEALAICGPTSSGKSRIAVRIARAIGGEIVNADSRQIYRGMTVGTGAPTTSEMHSVAHHLFGFVDPCERYSAGAFVADARCAIEAIRSRGNVPIVVGGTGLYVEALAGTMPLDRPIADDAVRERVRREAGTHSQEFLWAWVTLVDRNAGARVMARDRYRTLRALEACLARRAGAAPERNHARGLKLRIAVLRVPHAELARRIEARVRFMFERGLVEEALTLRQRCPDAPALTSLGYAEALAWQRGEATRNEAVSGAIARTRRYAKRQETWFRRLREAALVDAIDEDDAVRSVGALAREFATSM